MNVEGCGKVCKAQGGYQWWRGGWEYCGECGKRLNVCVSVDEVDGCGERLGWQHPPLNETATHSQVASAVQTL